VNLPATSFTEAIRRKSTEDRRDVLQRWLDHLAALYDFQLDLNVGFS
jgi:hypothetical protein